MSNKIYHSLGLGGTFDHLHKGHEFFLQYAAALAEHLKIGLATNQLIHEKLFVDSIQSFEERQKTLKAFLETAQISAEIFALDDPIGPTLEENFVEALAVTPLTQRGAEVINQARAAQHLVALPLHICTLVKDENGEFISSTRIREGIIDRQGKVFLHVLLQNSNLSEAQKQQFHQKQGKIVELPLPQIQRRYVVGDIVLETFIQQKWPYLLGIYDGKNHRQEYASAALGNIQPDQMLKNSAGEISVMLAQALRQTLIELIETDSLPINLKIEGEEDLAAVALGLLAPLGSAVYYGQPKEGIVEMIVTEKLKAKFAAILEST